MRLSTCALAGLLCCASLAAGGDDAGLAAKAQAVLKRYCAACHGQEGSAKGGFSYVLDRDRLIARGKVVPGDAAESLLYQRMHAGEMPPAGKQPRPTKEDVAVLERWIAAGAPAVAVAKAREFVPDSAVLKAVAADLETIEPRHRRHIRYFTLTHLANAGAGDGELQTTRQALSKLLNSLSWHTRVTRPRAVDGEQTIYRIDLRNYKWTGSSWDRLVTAYPYRPATRGSTLKALAKATESELPVLHADWFVATASRAPLYYDLLQMPTSERTLERLLQVDVIENLKEELAVRAGFNDSGVSKNNRIIERHDAAYGAYWRSYDFAANTGRQNIFEHPLGPNTGETSFSHAGGEIIFNLPNGLHGFLLTDAKGRRLDKAPGEIVADPKRPDQRVEPGLSCMSCHVRGLIPKADQVRGHVDKNAKAFAKADRERIQALYAPKAKMQALMDEDVERYMRALAKVGWAPPTEPDPVGGAHRTENAGGHPRG